MQHTPYWNITAGMLIDLVALVALAVAGFGIYRIWLKIRGNQLTLRVTPQAVLDTVKKADVKNFALGGLLGLRVYRDKAAGICHGLLFWGMFCLFIGTALVAANVFLGLPVMSGGFYKWGMAFGLDTAGLAVIVGVLYLMFRRLTNFHRISNPEKRPGFVLVEVLILAVVVSGFVVEGLRVLSLDVSEPSYMGQAFAVLLSPLSDQALSIHRLLWWIHGIGALCLIAYIPFSPLVHLILVPVNAAFSEPHMGADVDALDLDSMDLDSMELDSMDPGDMEMDEDATEEDLPRFGAAALDDFSLKQRLDFSSCLWCGRCQEVCPAVNTQKQLNPKGIINTMAAWQEAGRFEDENLIDTISQDVLFECRTCGACTEVCPGFVNPIKSIWQMRRHLVMDRGEMPDEVIQISRNMEAMMHPFATSASPDEWRKGLDVPVFKANETEYLLWIGCAVTYENRAQAVGRAMVNILNRCGVSYGILEEARCTGDPAKQLGDDFMFSMMAGANIEVFNSLGVKKIITMCPHCYNSFKHYYPPMGGEFQLIPHALLLAGMIETGVIRMADSGNSATYHDPCYLGRHNRIFDAPRNIVKTAAALTEMPDCEQKSMCCGAGGGNYWIEEAGDRINQARAKQAHDTGAGLLVSSCPFCLLMLTDGMKNFSDNTEVIDIAELVDRQMHIDTAPDR